MSLKTKEKVIAIHQPNYIPWQGFFYKMIHCDTFVFLDDALFSKNNIINRNKIKTNNGEIWLTVPVLTKHLPQQPINEVKINNTFDWRRKHWNSIQQYYSKAPFFKEYALRLKEIYDRDWEHLADLNKLLIKFIAECLGIKRRIVESSKLGLTSKGTDLLVDICKEFGADTYLSGKGGKKYMDEGKFAAARIKIEYTNFKQPRYPQLYGEFMPNLSTLDILFNKGVESRIILEGA